MKGANNTYLGSIFEGISSVFSGLRLTFRHLLEASTRRKTIGVQHPQYFKQDKGIVTVEYPYEAIPVPDHGRYRLHNEIDDCIVCDLCAKICPVNCIDIEVVKATEEIGKTSDGTTKRLFAARFDIDMAKCMYCGLCTTVCPTECLTMTKVYDFSEFDVRNFVYHFTDLSPAQAVEKKLLFEEKQKEKEIEKEKQKENENATGEEGSLKASPDTTPKIAPFKPVIKPALPQTEVRKAEDQNPEQKIAPKPAFKPVIKIPGIKAESPKVEGTTEKENQQVNENTSLKINSGEGSGKGEGSPESRSEVKPSLKPVFKPVIKPIIPKKDKEQE